MLNGEDLHRKDAEMRARVVARCAELGLSQREVIKQARLAHDYLQTDPSKGRRVDLLERLAVPLQWTLPELLGHTLRAHVDLELLGEAHRRALDVGALDPATFVKVLGAVYNALIDSR